MFPFKNISRSKSNIHQKLQQIYTQKSVEIRKEPESKRDSNKEKEPVKNQECKITAFQETNNEQQLERKGGIQNLLKANFI